MKPINLSPGAFTRQAPPAEGERKRWYNIAKTGAGATLHLYDDIGYWGIMAQDLIAELAGVTGPLEVHLNTHGGEIFEGVAIYNYLAQYDGEVTVVVDALAASIGSVIAMAASPGQLKMAPYSKMMIHDGAGVCMGNAADMRELAALLDDMSDNIASVYADRTGQTAGHWRALMQAETWFGPEEAVAASLADAVLPRKGADPDGDGDAAKPAAAFAMPILARCPAPAPAAAQHAPSPAGPALTASTSDPSPGAPASFAELARQYLTGTGAGQPAPAHDDGGSPDGGHDDDSSNSAPAWFTELARKVSGK